MMARYTQIKETGFNDEDAENLNSITKALASIGITATDSAGQLRPYEQVLDEVGAKWSGLEKNQQSYIATAMAGAFQMNRFLILMQNYDDVLKNTEASINSVGDAQKKMDIALESNATKMARLTESFTQFYHSIIDSRAIGMILDLSVAVMQFANSGDTVMIALGLLTTGLIMLTPAIISATTAMIAFTASLLTNPLFLAATAIGVVVAGLYKFSKESAKATEQHKEFIKNLKESTDKTAKSLSDANDEAVKLLSSISDLTEVEKLNADQKDRILDVQSELIKQNPAMLAYIEKEKVGVEQLIDAYNRYKEDIVGVQRMANSVELGRLKDKKKIIESQITSQYRFENTPNAKGYKPPKDLDTMGRLANDLKKIDEEIKIREQSEVQLKAAFVPITTKDIKPPPPSVTGTGSKNKSKTQSAEESYAVVEKERYTKLNLAIKNVNIEIERNKAIQENTKDLVEKNKLRNQEIELYKQKQKAIANLAKEQRKERDELIKTLKASGAKFAGSGDSASFENYQTMRNKLIDKMNSERTKKDKTVYNQTKAQLEELDKQFTRFAELQTELIPQARLEWTKLSGEINNTKQAISDDLTKAIEEANEKAKKALEESIDVLEDFIKLTTDDLKKAFEKSEDFIEKEAKASENAFNSKIEAIKNEMDLQEEQNDLLEDQIAKQEKLLALAKLKEERANILSQRNVRFLGANGWEFIADPQALKENAEKIADAEKDLLEFETNLKTKEAKRAKEAQIKELESQRDKEKEIYEKRKSDLKFFSESILEQIKSTNGITQSEQDKLYNQLLESDRSYWSSRLQNVLEMTAKIREAQYDISSLKGESGYSGNYTNTARPTITTGGTSQAPSFGMTEYANGGLMDYTGVAKIHGSKAFPELALNQSQIANMAGMLGISGSPAQMAQGLYNTAKNGINKVMNSGGGISIGNITLPNVSNANQFVKELQRLRIVNT